MSEDDLLLICRSIIVVACVISSAVMAHASHDGWPWLLAFAAFVTVVAV